MTIRKTDLGTLICDNDGREAVRFVTPSGVIAVIDTSISTAALLSFAKSLERKMRRAGHVPEIQASEATPHKGRPRSKAA